MLHVKTPEEVLALIEKEFASVAGAETVSLSAVRKKGQVAVPVRILVLMPTVITTLLEPSTPG